MWATSRPLLLRRHGGRKAKRVATGAANPFRENPCFCLFLAIGTFGYCYHDQRSSADTGQPYSHSTLDGRKNFAAVWRVKVIVCVHMLAVRTCKLSWGVRNAGTTWTLRLVKKRGVREPNGPFTMLTGNFPFKKKRHDYPLPPSLLSKPVELLH